MSVETYVGSSSQIWCWSLHETILGGLTDFGIYMCIGLYMSAIALVFSNMLTILNGVSLMT